jgi:hypothetical protein
MYTGTTISLKEIMWKVMRNPLVADYITYEDAAEFAIEALRLIGSPLILETKISDLIKLNTYKAAVPLNSIKILGIREICDLEDYENGAVALTYATNTFHKSENCETEYEQCPEEYTYTVENGVIKTSFEEGYIQVAYKCLSTDQEGYPLIPDDQDTKFAIEYYILFKYLEPLWMMGKITDKAFSYIDQKKCWYIGAAGTSTKIQSMDHVEAIMNTINRLIINSDAHKNFFKQLGKKERLKRYF